MARVCQDWFPNKENPELSGFVMDDTLKLQIDVLLRNIKNDWDFTIIVAGEGEVRVGKSKIAMDIGAYWTYEIWKRYGYKRPFDVKTNFCFNGQNLIKQGNYLGQNYPYSCLIFDEAGADLEGRKSMQTQTQDVLDYFRECGQYNMLNILVLPEFFDLPKGIALTRSIFLLNVYYSSDDTGKFIRGYFNFFSKRQKKWLYLKGKRDLNYNAVKYDFHGKFGNFYQVDEAEYREAKQEALKKRETKHRNKFLVQRNALMYLLCGEKQDKDIKSGKALMSQQQLSERLEQMTSIPIERRTISDALMGFKIANDEFEDE